VGGTLRLDTGRSRQYAQLAFRLAIAHKLAVIKMFKWITFRSHNIHLAISLSSEPCNQFMKSSAQDWQLASSFVWRNSVQPVPCIAPCVTSILFLQHLCSRTRVQ